jgi:endonuclease/exonuclease/phosphatase family metal-dependent hydrolase
MNIFYFVIAFFLLSNPEHPLDNTNEPFRVMSFNIRYDNPDDGVNAWKYRKNVVASLIRFHRNDLIGTQEALLNQIQDLDEFLPEFAWIGVGRDDGKLKGEFCAIFYRKDRFELIEDGTFWLSEHPEVPGSKSWDAAITRIVTWGRFYDLKNKNTFIVFNTHYDHIGVQAREKSSELILQKIRLLSQGDPVILLGDLNAIETDSPYSILTKPQENGTPKLFDAFYHAKFGHYGPKSTWNAFREIEPNRRIDFILLDKHFSVIQHGILSDTKNGRFPSDHLPVIADIQIHP